MPKAKDRLDKTNANEEVNNVESLHVQDVNASKSNQASMKKVATNLKTKGIRTS